MLYVATACQPLAAVARDDRRGEGHVLCLIFRHVGNRGAVYNERAAHHEGGIAESLARANAPFFIRVEVDFLSQTSELAMGKKAKGSETKSAPLAEGEVHDRNPPPCVRIFTVIIERRDLQEALKKGDDVQLSGLVAALERHNLKYGELVEMKGGKYVRAWIGPA